jgi:hypothetical protein
LNRKLLESVHARDAAPPRPPAGMRAEGSLEALRDGLRPSGLSSYMRNQPRGGPPAEKKDVDARHVLVPSPRAHYNEGPHVGVRRSTEGGVL